MKMASELGERTIIVATMILLAALSATARTFDFKATGTIGSSSGGAYWYSDVTKKKSAFFQVKIGSAAKADDKSKMEIRAATVFKNTKDKKTGINDVATFSFDPVNVSKPLFFVVATGTANSRTDRYYVGSDRSSGWQVSGIIIEIWQRGKAIKHWTNIPGNGGKAKLTEDVKQMHIWADGRDRSWHGDSGFDNATEIFALNKRGEKADIEDVLKECAALEDADVQTNDNRLDEDDKDGTDGEFVMKSFCGFEFGEKRSEFDNSSGDRIVTLKKPFRNYTRARLEYGLNTGKLIAVTLLSGERFNSGVERSKVATAAAAVIEKKYGIALSDTSSNYGASFHYSDERTEIWVHADNISVRRRDIAEKERKLRDELREETKRQIKRSNADDGADVL